MSVATWPWLRGQTISTVTIRILETDPKKIADVKEACEVAIEGWRGIRSWLTRDKGVQFRVKPRSFFGGSMIRYELLINAIYGSGSGASPTALVNGSGTEWRDSWSTGPHDLPIWQGTMHVGDKSKGDRFNHIACHEMGHALGLWHEQISPLCPDPVFDDLVNRDYFYDSSLAEIVTKVDELPPLLRHAVAPSRDFSKDLTPSPREACYYIFDGREVFDEESVMLYGYERERPSELDKRTVSALWGGEQGFEHKRISDFYSSNVAIYQRRLTATQQHARARVDNLGNRPKAHILPPTSHEDPGASKKRKR